MERATLRYRRDRRRPGRLRRRHPRRAARAQDRSHRARASRRHLPQLGLHPDQGAAPHRRALPRDRPGERVRLALRQSPLRSRQGGRAQPQGRGSAFERRRLSDAQAQDRRDRRHGPARRAGEDRRHRQGRRQTAHRRSQAYRHRHRRPRAGAAGNGSRRQAHLDLQAGDGAAAFAEIAADRRLRRHRHRVRELLPHAWRRGDGGRDARSHPAERGRGDLGAGAQGLRQAGHDHPYRHDGRVARPAAATASRRCSRSPMARAKNSAWTA